MRLVVGQISYLNSQPFYPLLLGEHRLIPTPPSELGRMAARGEIDAGILATADYLVNSERYEPVAGLGVANREEVRSILLASRRPIEDLDGAVVGVTEETSTSARLLRLILEARYGVRPRSYVRGARSEATAFLGDIEDARERAFTATQRRAASAAGRWVLAFNARCELSNLGNRAEIDDAEIPDTSPLGRLLRSREAYEYLW